VDSGKMRLLVTFGEKRTTRWPDVPTAQELGYKVVSTSPYGLAGPKGMDPAVVKTLHDAFKKALFDPASMDVMKQLNQEPAYRNSQDYKEWAQATYVKEKGLIEYLGLMAKD
jgi:tripartite-type tricarboxylate transporter receptor subunit TctC